MQALHEEWSVLAHWGMIGKLLPGIIHAISNSLSTLNTQIYILKRNVPKEAPYFQKINEIDQTAAEASEIIHKIHRFQAKSEATIEHNIQEVIKDMLVLLDFYIQLKKLDVIFSIEDTLPQLQIKTKDIYAILSGFLHLVLEQAPDNGTFSKNQMHIKLGYKEDYFSLQINLQYYLPTPLPDLKKHWLYLALNQADTNLQVSQEQDNIYFDLQIKQA